LDDKEIPHTTPASSSSTILAMCNGQSSRQSQGGAIAILKPAIGSTSQSLQQELRVRFEEDLRSGKTTAFLDGAEAATAAGGNIVI